MSFLRSLYFRILWVQQTYPLRSATHYSVISKSPNHHNKPNQQHEGAQNVVPSPYPNAKDAVEEEEEAEQEGNREDRYLDEKLDHGTSEYEER